MAKKVMVGMSGGVDSSVAVLLLKQQGYEVSGATLKLHDGFIPDECSNTRTCCSLNDVMDARSAAHRLGAEHFVFNFTGAFRQYVIQKFCDSYLSGDTPNPCIDCNRYIKFGKLLERAQLMQQDYIATGHYARVCYHPDSGRYLLKKPLDKNKDQTYALYSMTQHELAHTLFPLGDFTKEQVRLLAEKHGLLNARKPDSQDICFVPDGDYAAFLEKELKVQSPPGDFTDSSGIVLGRHQGIIKYTIGQRKGLGLSFDSPRYVIEKNRTTNTIVLGLKEALYQHHLLAGDLNFISIPALTGELEVSCKIRYRQQEVPALLHPRKDGTVLVEFSVPQRAPAPGQAVVFYDGDIVVGGGTILNKEKIVCI